MKRRPTRAEVFKALRFADCGTRTELEIMRLRMDALENLEKRVGTHEARREELAVMLGLHYADEWDKIIPAVWRAIGNKM